METLTWISDEGSSLRHATTLHIDGMFVNYGVQGAVVNMRDERLNW
jgi:hypothetical protein